MDRRLRIGLALVLVASTAGCSALLDGGATPTAHPDGATPSAGVPTGTSTGAPPVDSTPTVTPTTTARVTPTDSGPTATPAPTRTFDASALQDAHVARLREAGSFRTASALVIRTASATRYINGSYAVETDGPARNTANITYVNTSDIEDFPVTTRYTAGDTTWERRLEDNGTVYRRGTVPYNESDPDPVDRRVASRIGRIAFDVVDGSTWVPTGTGTVDGANVTRYDTGGDRFGATGYRDARGTATLVVDEHGIVRYVAYRFVATTDGERTTYVYQAGYTDVGNTKVEEPAWTDRA